MTFTDQLRNFTAKAEDRTEKVFSAVVGAAAASIVFGSEITGAPGQPEDLRDGQWKAMQDSPTSAKISTTDPSARAVETGISHFDGHPIHFHSPIGGLHSMGDTVSRFEALVEDVARRADA